MIEGYNPNERIVDKDDTTYFVNACSHCPYYIRDVYDKLRGLGTEYCTGEGQRRTILGTDTDHDVFQNCPFRRRYRCPERNRNSSITTSPL